jgi:hypothetical protein
VPGRELRILEQPPGKEGNSSLTWGWGEGISLLDTGV